MMDGIRALLLEQHGTNVILIHAIKIKYCVVSYNSLCTLYRMIFSYIKIKINTELNVICWVINLLIRSDSRYVIFILFICLSCLF